MARTGGRTAPCRRLHPHQGIGRTAEPHPKPHRNGRHSDTAPGSAPTRHTDKKPSEAMPTCRLRTASFCSDPFGLAHFPKNKNGNIKREKARQTRQERTECSTPEEKASYKIPALTNGKTGKSRNDHGRAPSPVAACRAHRRTLRRVLEYLPQSTRVPCGKYFRELRTAIIRLQEKTNRKRGHRPGQQRTGRNRPKGPDTAICATRERKEKIYQIMTA